MIVTNENMWYTILYVCQNNIFINCRIDRKGAFMETVKDIKDFKRFIELNRDKLYARAENANDIAIDDEWMQKK